MAVASGEMARAGRGCSARPPPRLGPMGVHGLMAAVRDRTTVVQLSAFKGQVIAVDGNVWIHKGMYGCALELASGMDSDAFVLYCVRQTNRLRQCGVYPLVVFDGRKLEAKGPEHARRKDLRAQANLGRRKAVFSSGGMAAFKGPYQSH